MKRVVLLLLVLLGAYLGRAGLDLPAWGDAGAPANVHVSPHYITRSLEETAVPNFVTAVLADYRGYDTMFETMVIFCAGITVLAILRRTHRRSRKEVRPRPQRAGADVILQTTARLLVPPMQIFALYVVAHGHHSPGGGFQGGVILGASFILLALSYDMNLVLRRFRERALLRFSAVGVLIYSGIGVVSMALGGNLLDYGAWSGLLGVSPVEARSHGMLGVEVGVALTVMAIMLSLYVDLASGGDLDEGL